MPRLFQYEAPDLDNYKEIESERVAQMEKVDNCDVIRLKEVFSEMGIDSALGWTDLYQKTFSPGTFIIDTADADKVSKYASLHPSLIFNKRPLSSVRNLDLLLRRINEVLESDGYFWCHSRTALLKKRIILSSYVFPLNYLIYWQHFFWHRACPKLPFFDKIYFKVTKGENRTYNRVEILGRLSRAGFDIVDEGFLHGEFFVLGRKVREPIVNDQPSCSPIIKLKRIGLGGRTIGVYKFRTMYSYSEYIQGYVYSHDGLGYGGKFKDDYRVSDWGRVLRTFWLDELPMFVNLLKGDIKLVGVRPLSPQYFELYSKEMRDLRIKTKPGLIPPFYYEKRTPVTLDEIQDSERAYIEQYLRHPFRTDWKYFWGVLWNIVFNRKRSK